jgi:hypothetical protein
LIASGKTIRRTVQQETAVGQLDLEGFSYLLFVCSTSPLLYFSLREKSE